MGVERLQSLLRSRRLVALDSSVLIYQIDANPRYFPFSDTVFAWMEMRGNSAITSILSMTELLVPAYRDGNRQRIEKYHGLLTTLPALRWIPPDLHIADLAAQLRAAYGLKTPDAFHAATALHGNVHTLVTNDPVFRRIKGLDVLILDEFA